MENRASRLVSWYRGLSPLARRGLWLLVALEGVLIMATELDIHQRPAQNVRGPKLLWRVIATQNIIGPAAYFAVGRKTSR